MRIAMFVAVSAITTSSLPAQTLVVLNKNDATAQLFEVSTGKTLATLPTGNGPHEVAISHDGKLAVVADYGGSTGPGKTLTVIDLTTRQIARTVSMGAHVRPHGITFLPDNRTVVVTAETEGLIITVDVVVGEIKSEKKTGQTLGHMVVMSPDMKTAYVANIRSGSLSIIDYAGNAEPVIVKVGAETEAINLTPDGKLLWMGSNTTGKVYVVDVAARKVIDSVQTKQTPYRIAFTPDSKTAMIVNPRVDEVQIVDVATRKIHSTVSLAVAGVANAAPFGIVLTPGGKTAWVTLSGAARAVEFDISSGKVLRTFMAGNVPDGIGYSMK